MMRHELNSYKQLPMSFYQLQTKFRDEQDLAPALCGPAIHHERCLFFFMNTKHHSEQTYQDFYGAYVKIFTLRTKFPRCIG